MFVLRSLMLSCACGLGLVALSLQVYRQDDKVPASGNVRIFLNGGNTNGRLASSSSEAGFHADLSLYDSSESGFNALADDVELFYFNRTLRGARVMRTETAEVVTSVAQIQAKLGRSAKLYLLRSSELWMWSAEHVGYKRLVSVADGRHVEMETLSTEPALFLVNNLLTDEMCTHMIDQATQRGVLDSSQFSKFGGRKERDEFRTSTSVFLENPSSLTAEATTLLASLTRVPLAVSETLQVLHYEPNTHYHHHHDSDNHPDLNARHSQRSEWAARRLLTGLVYLNDVPDELAGGTNFPFSQTDTRNAHMAEALRQPGVFGRDPQGVAAAPLSHTLDPLGVKPRRGSVALFYNLRQRDNMDGWVDPFALHSGCDLLQTPANAAQLKMAAAGSVSGGGGKKGKKKGSKKNAAPEKWAANFWQWNHLDEDYNSDQHHHHGGGYMSTASVILDDGAPVSDDFIRRYGLRRVASSVYKPATTATTAAPEKQRALNSLEDDVDDGEDDDEHYPEDDL